MPWNSQFWTSLSLDSLLWLLLVASSLLLLVGLFIGNIEDLQDGYALLKRRRETTPTSGTGSYASCAYEALYLSQRFLHGSLLAKIMVSMYLTISLIGLAVSSRLPVVLEDNDVHVLAVSDDRHALLLKSPTRGTYRLVICGDARNDYIMKDVNPQVGYSLDRLVWQATGRGCSSVDEGRLTGPLGFWWHKDSKGWALKTTKETEQ